MFLHSDYSNCASRKWLKSISVVNSRSWHKILKGTDMDRHCHKGQNSHMKNGDVAPPVPEAPEVLNNTKQRRGYKIPREFQASQKVKDVPSSSYRVQGARNQLLFSMDVQSQAEGLYVVSLHLVNLSPFVRPRFKPSAPLEMCLMSTRSHREIIKHCQAQYF